MKRAVDLAVASLMLTLLSPLLAMIAVAIKSTSRGPVLFRGTRIGRHGIPFVMLKFRTMVPEAEAQGGSSTPADDPRVTPIGRLLRRYKLDELPQLINIVRGDMSLVGPRPQVPWAVDLYTPHERALLSVPPGLTDYASLRFRNEADLLHGAADPDQAYLQIIAPEKIRLGLEYVRRHTLSIDLLILVATVWSSLGGDPAHVLRFPDPQEPQS